MKGTRGAAGTEGRDLRVYAVAGRSPFGRGGHRRAARVGVAAEARGSFDALRDAGGAEGVGDGLVALAAAVDVVAATDLDGLSDAALERLAVAVSRPANRLLALRTTIAGVLQTRAVRAAGPGGEQRAKQAVRRRLQDGGNLSPADAKQATETGARLQDAPAAQAAFADGRISPAHARVITDTLQQIPPERRAEVEADLTALAGRMDPVALGRAGRQAIAREDQAAAARADERRHARRSVRASRTADGMYSLHAPLSGTGAETVETALRAFSTVDRARELRSPEQRAADALVAVAEAALRSQNAPTQHGVRPHVLLVLRQDDDDGAGWQARFASGEPVPDIELPALLRDCDIARVLVDAEATPIEVTRAVRTVPAGLWRALVARDGGCTWPGCDAPAAWCDVAHGAITFHAGGRLHPGNAALLCRRHHRRFDGGGWRIHIDGDQVRYQRHRPDDPDRPDRPDRPGQPDRPDPPDRPDRGPPG